jgi:hypothetical protein
MAKKGDADKAKAAPKAKSAPKEHWGKTPAEHDYPAAAAYLSLLCSPTEVRRVVAALRAAPLTFGKAKDLLRASGLALLPPENAHVASDLAKVDKGVPLSPVLLVRGDLGAGLSLTIADGYHRVCASYHLDENADIPCHLAGFGITRARSGTRTTSSRAQSTVR